MSVKARMASSGNYHPSIDGSLQSYFDCSDWWPEGLLGQGLTFPAQANWDHSLSLQPLLLATLLSSHSAALSLQICCLLSEGLNPPLWSTGHSSGCYLPEWHSCLFHVCSSVLGWLSWLLLSLLASSPSICCSLSLPTLGLPTLGLPTLGLSTLSLPRPRTRSFSWSWISRSWFYCSG